MSWSKRTATFTSRSKTRLETKPARSALRFPWVTNGAKSEKRCSVGSGSHSRSKLHRTGFSPSFILTTSQWSEKLFTMSIMPQQIIPTGAQSTKNMRHGKFTLSWGCTSISEVLGNHCPQAQRGRLQLGLLPCSDERWLEMDRGCSQTRTLLHHRI